MKHAKQANQANQARRDFLVVASVTAISVTPLWQLSALAPSCARRLIVSFDKDLPDSHAFALSASAAGARSMALSGDTGDMWFELLKRGLTSPQFVFAGLTRHADAFLLARLAQGAGMRTAQRSEGALTMWRFEPAIA
jgi:hypothetical protein